MYILKAGLFRRKHKLAGFFSYMKMEALHMDTSQKHDRYDLLFVEKCKARLLCIHFLLSALKPMKEKHFETPWQYDWALNISENKCQLCFW